MRTNATLEAAQKGYSVDAVSEIYYWNYTGRPSDGGDHWARIDYLSSKDRIVDINPFILEPRNQEATVYLNNADGAFNSYNLKDKWIRIGFGIGSEISYSPYFKVAAQDFSSTKGKPRDTYILSCIGAWNLLLKYIVPESLFFNQADLEPSLDNMTARQIADYILEDAGLDLGADISTDGKIETWKPQMDIYAGQNGLAAMLTILAPFQCALLPRTDCMHLLSGNTGDSYTYELKENITYHPFSDGSTRSLIYKPMKATVKSLDEVYEGSYADSGWTSEMGSLKWTDVYNIVTSNADCQHIAQSIVDRAKSNADSGIIKVPIMNCLQELYDPVTIVDDRGNISGSGVVGGIYLRYKPGNKREKIKGIFSMELRLGGLQRSTPSDIESFVDLISATGSGMFSGNVIIPGSINPELLRKTMQPYRVDIDWSSSAYNSVSWTCGNPTITFADKTTQNLTTSGSPKTLTATHFAYFVEGNTTIQWSQNFDDTVGKDRGLLAVCVIGDSGDQKALILPSNGKEPVINCNLLYADMILASHIKAGELVIGGKVTGNLADLSEKNTSSLDQVTNYKLVTDNEKTGAARGYIGLDSDGQITQYVDGSGLTDPSMTGKAAGLYLTASKFGYWDGTAWTLFFNNAGSGYFKGSIYASTIVSGQTVTVQGAISAAGGIILIDNNGITVIAPTGYEYMRFKNASETTIGRIFNSTLSNFVIEGVDDLVVQAYGDAIFQGVGLTKILSQSNITIDSDVAVTIDADTTLYLKSGTSSSYSIELTGYCFDAYSNAVRFMPRRLNQSTQPVYGTGSTAIRNQELLVWRDSDDGKIYLVYQEGTGANKKVELT